MLMFLCVVLLFFLFKQQWGAPFFVSNAASQGVQCGCGVALFFFNCGITGECKDVRGGPFFFKCSITGECKDVRGGPFFFSSWAKEEISGVGVALVI